MLLGLVTYMWGAEWDLPTVIKNCQLTGFKGVELRSGHKHGVEPSLGPDERRDVAKRFADSGVTLVGLGSACEYHSPDPAVLKKQIEDTKAFITLCHDCGGTGVKVRPNALSKEVPAQQTLEQIGQALNEVAAFGEGYGVQIRLEVHGKETSALPHIRSIMDVAKHPNAAICWNCNPSDLDGGGLEANFNLVKNRLGTIHIHDLITKYPWQQLFGLLKEANFNGWTLVEEGKQTTDPIRVMQYYRLLWETMAG
ncbi:MAG TPA: sugar phosphate isomerase/epimerase family protein [Pirellulales bacterium]|jgi:sugar phosphate isomerase/epimerase|nr:sugar phosphate isomerase/epimerase family protein [Pirellulales bacterium]